MSDLPDTLVVYAMGVCSMSVCVPISMPREEIEKEANRVRPTGISSLWTISDDPTFKEGSPNPCPCNFKPETRLHYLLNC